MSNLIDYIKWRGDVPFNIDKLNDVDILLLSQISYLDFSGLVSEDFKNSISLSMLSDLFFKSKDVKKRSNLGVVINSDTVELFRLAAKSLRFKNLYVCGYINKIDIKSEEQFSAILFSTKSFFRTHIVVFKGTDDTIIGWKEDFNMTFFDKIPAQNDATNYINSACQKLKGKFIVSGHSKGGNLAFYASAFGDKKSKKKIKQVYNFDGPGFTKKIQHTLEYKNTCTITKTFYPYKSIVGMLFNPFDKFSVIDSSNNGIFQHDAMSWQIEKNQFINKPKLDNFSINFNKSFNKWLKEQDSEKLKSIIDSLFFFLESTGAKTNSEIVSYLTNEPTKLIKSLKSVNKEVRAEVTKLIKFLIKNSIENH